MEMNKMDYINISIRINKVGTDEIGCIDELCLDRRIKVDDMFKLFGDINKLVNESKQ